MLHLNQLSKYIGSLRRALEPKSIESEPQQVLGSTTAVKNIAAFWDKQAMNIHVIGASELHKWTQDKDFDAKELKAFKEGLAAIPLFMLSCHELVENGLSDKQ